jgi:hypothetical protein
MKEVGERCGAQTAEAKEVPSTGASVLETLERGAEALTPASAEMGAADPPIRFSAACSTQFQVVDPRMSKKLRTAL